MIRGRPSISRKRPLSDDASSSSAQQHQQLQQQMLSTDKSESSIASRGVTTNDGDVEWESRYCDIPEPVLLSVLIYLDVKDVVAAGGTCQRWNQIAKDNWLWRKLFQRDFGLPLNTKIGIRPGTCVKTLLMI